MSRLLLLGCSARKRESSAALPAIELYDGPAFRIVRRYLPGDGTLRTVVLSAQHGVIEATESIAWYDRELERQQLGEFGSRVEIPLTRLFSSGFSSIFISLGAMYMAAVAKPLRSVAATTPVTIASGPPGVRAAMLGRWLRTNQEAHQFASRPKLRTQIGGIEFEISQVSILASARAFLTNIPAGALRFHSWCVVVDGVRVSPKWLVSIATGLNVSQFSTHTACRVLTRLGFEVHPA